tara:strand:- start:110 stop:1678 length:1569 start_codon:yes stop_codon:yes gene_type:complete
MGQVFKHYLSLLKLNQLSLFALCYGLFLRLYCFIANKTIWHDEASIFFSLQSTPFSKLHLPLQGSPGGSYLFNLIEKIMFDFSGFSDYALRLFPFIFSCLSLYLFFVILSRNFNHLICFLGTFLFAINDNLIFYAADIRPYSLDVLVTTIVLYLFFQITSENQLTSTTFFKLSLIGSVLIFSSFISIFLLFSFGISVLIYFFNQKDFRFIKHLIITGLIWVIVFYIYYTVSLQYWSDEESMIYYGNVFQFLHFPITSLYELFENLIQFFRIIAFFCGLRLQAIGLYPSDFISSLSSMKLFSNLVLTHGIYLSWIIILIVTTSIIIIFSTINCFKTYKNNFFIIFIPIMLAIIASCLLKYPFLGRHLLYLFPLIILSLTFFLNELYKSKKTWFWVCFFILFSFPFLNSIYHISNPRTLYGLKQVLTIIETKKAKHTYILPLYSNWELFYKDNYNLNYNTVTTLSDASEIFQIPLTINTIWLMYYGKSSKLSQIKTHFLNHDYVIDEIPIRDTNTYLFFIKKTL